MAKAPMVPPRSRLLYYGLTEEHFIALWNAQDGKCVLCERSFTKSRPPHIDHDHHTGLVRGLLCGTCNQKIGWDHEDAGWYRRAAGYLTGDCTAGRLQLEALVRDAPPRQE